MRNWLEGRVFDLYCSGMSVSEIVEQFPGATRSQVVSILRLVAAASFTTFQSIAGVRGWPIPEDDPEVELPTVVPIGVRNRLGALAE